MTNLNIAISACLLGENVRYDGGHKLCSTIADDKIPYLLRHPVCPEVAIGLGVPRPTLGLVGDESGAVSMVTHESGEDWTVAMNSWSKETVEGFRQDWISGVVLKSRSPSCGIGDVLVEDSFRSERRLGSGLFTAIAQNMLPGLPLIDETGFRDALARDEFLASAFAYKRACAFFGHSGNSVRLNDFHQLHEPYWDDLDSQDDELHIPSLGERSGLTKDEFFQHYGAFFLARAKFGILSSDLPDFFPQLVTAQSVSLSHKKIDEILASSIEARGVILDAQLQLSRCLCQSDRQLWIHNPTNEEIEMRRYCLDLESE